MDTTFLQTRAHPCGFLKGTGAWYPGEASGARVIVQESPGTIRVTGVGREFTQHPRSLPYGILILLGMEWTQVSARRPTVFS